MGLKIGQKVRIAEEDGPSQILYSVVFKGHKKLQDNVLRRVYFISPCDIMSIDPENIPRYEGWYTRRELCREPISQFDNNTSLPEVPLYYPIKFKRQQWDVIDQVITMAASSNYNPYRTSSGDRITPSVMSSFEDFVQTMIDVAKQRKDLSSNDIKDLATILTTGHSYKE